jgi:hypothetical protein
MIILLCLNLNLNANKITEQTAHIHEALLVSSYASGYRLEIPTNYRSGNVVCFL